MERSTSWNEIERLAVDRFYPDYAARLIALGIRRTTHAVRDMAYANGIMAKTSEWLERETLSFWVDWHTFILENMGTKGITELTWKPAQDIPCEKCELGCNRYAVKLLCERFTVREMLEHGDCLPESSLFNPRIAFPETYSTD